MTVADLIIELRKFDQSLEVRMLNPEVGPVVIDSLVEAEIVDYDDWAGEYKNVAIVGIA